MRNPVEIEKGKCRAEWVLKKKASKEVQKSAEIHAQGNARSNSG